MTGLSKEDVRRAVERGHEIRDAFCKFAGFPEVQAAIKAALARVGLRSLAAVQGSDEAMRALGEYWIVVLKNVDGIVLQEAGK